MKDKVQPGQIFGDVSVSMSDRNRGKRDKAVAAAFGGLALLGAALLVYALGSLSGKQEGHGIKAAAEHYSDAKRHVSEACLDAEQGGLFECVYATVTATREYQRNEQGLSAQKGMHFWAVCMVVVGLLQTGVSTGALLLLMRDLKHNRQSAEAQLRAYITITNVRFGIGADNKIRATVEFKNSGTTPARDLQVHLTIHVQNWEEYRPINLPDKPAKWLESTAVIGAGEEAQISNDQGLKDDLSAPEILRRACLIAQGHVRYIDVFDEPRLTHFRYFSDNTSRSLGHGAIAAPHGNSLN